MYLRKFHNTQDLANYKVLSLHEPNSQFSATEKKTAIVNFVKNGGGDFTLLPTMTIAMKW